MTSSKEKKLAAQRRYFTKKPWVKLYHSAKQRARVLGVPFGLTQEYLQRLVEQNDGYCPVLKTPINNENPLSIDRIIPKLGYVNSNVRIISWRANTIRNNATVEELQLILKDAENMIDNNTTTHDQLNIYIPL